MKIKPNYKLDLQMFADDPEPTPPPAPKEETKKFDAVKVLKELQANSVSKEEYEAVVKENKELWDSVMEGKKMEKQKETPKRASIIELRDELYGSKRHPMTNLEYWTKTLDLRDQLLESGQADPMVPHGRKVRANANDYASAERVAGIFKELVKAADGDPAAFNGLLDKAGLGEIAKYRY